MVQNEILILQRVSLARISVRGTGKSPQADGAIASAVHERSIGQYSQRADIAWRAILLGRYRKWEFKLLRSFLNLEIPATRWCNSEFLRLGPIISAWNPTSLTQSRDR